MPKYTPADIEDAFNQGLINEKEKRFLRQKVFQDTNEEEGLTRKLVTKLSHEVTEGWKKIREGGTAANASAKENKGVIETAKGNIEIVAGALQILSSIPTVGGNLAGENVQDYLLKRGANQTVAALAATVADLTVQTFGGTVAYKGAKMLKGAATTAAKATGAAAATAKAGAEAVPTSEQVTKAVAEWITEKQNPKNLVDVIRPGQDVKLSSGGGVMQGERKALPSPTKQLNPPAIPMPPPPDMEKAGKLIDEAIASGEPLDLAALTQAVNAPNPVEAIKRGLHASTQAEGATKQLDMLTPPVFTSPKEPAAVSAEVMKRGQEFLAGERPLNPQKVLELIDKNTPGVALNYRNLREAIGGESYTKKTINITDLKFEKGSEIVVDPKLAMAEKGPIVVGPDNLVIDGRHRAFAAKERGETTIEAYVSTPREEIQKIMDEAKAAAAAEPAAPKPFRLTAGDTQEMRKRMEQETDPFTLFWMSMQQTTPRDIRQVAANRLNEINKKDVSNFLRNEADPEFLARIAKSNMFDPVTKQFAKDMTAKMQRGGLDVASNVDAMSRARMAYAEGEIKYEANRINMKELQAEAEKSKATINTVLNLKVGEPKTPLEVAQISKPVRDIGEGFIKNIDAAEAGIANGDYSKFWETMADFNLLVEAHWPYMSPRQVAGQTLKTYDEPVLSATRFLQQIPGFSSWLGKLKLNTVDEVEAAAPLIMREMQKIKAPGEISNYAQRIAEQMKDKGDEVFKDPTWRDKAYFYFVNSLMSGTDTIGRNITGNTLAVPWHYAEKQTSVLASKVINPFLSAEHKLDAGNFTDANAGMAIWFRTMWDSSKYVLNRQFDEIKGLVPSESAYSELFGNRFDLPKFSNTGTTNPIGGMTGKIIGTPVSIAQTSDEISRIAAYKMEVGTKLHQEWSSGERAIPWRQYMEEGFANPPPSIHEAGIRVANELTFSDPMSAMGKTVMAARRNLPGFEFVSPFVHTADRLTAFGYNRTPGLSLLSTRLMDEMRSGDPVAQAEAIGRVTLSMIVGSGIFAATKTNAPDGLPLITGGGPTDRALTMKMKNANIYQPYSIWTPAGRYSYGNLQPARLPIGMVADASEIWDEIKNPNDGTALWSGISLALTRNIFDVTYTKQIADLMDMWDKPSGSASFIQKFGANLIKGFVEPAIVRQMYHAAADPYVRETNGFMDELKKDIWAYGLPARRNPITQEPVLNPPRMLADVPGLGWVLPTSPIQPRNDKTAQTLRDLKHMPPDFPHTLGGNTASESPFGAGPLQEARDAAAGVKLEDQYRQEGQDYAAGKEGFDQTLSDEVDALIADPEFSKQAPLVQRDQINTIYHSRYKQATEMLKEKYPELQDAWEQKVAQRQQVRLPPEERDAFEQTYNAPADVVEPPPDFNVLPTEEPAP